jgi:putative addiction module CopG family antidote
VEVSLPPQLEEFVRAQVRSGRYADEQEVVRDALRQMRALVKAAEDPTIVGLVRDAIGLANTAQKEVVGMLATAEKEQSLFGDVLSQAGAVANTAYGAVRKVPGARELDRIIRVPIGGITFAAQQGELQGKAMRANLETTAKALGMLTAVLERVNQASRAVGNTLSQDQ